MKNDSEAAFDERIIVELKRLSWCQGLSESAIADIVAVGEYVDLKGHQTGQYHADQMRRHA